jgi:hypothetical protein
VSGSAWSATGHLEVTYFGSSVFENRHSLMGGFVTGHRLGKTGSDLGEGIGKSLHARTPRWHATGLLQLHERCVTIVEGGVGNFERGV